MKSILIASPQEAIEIQQCLTSSRRGSGNTLAVICERVEARTKCEEQQREQARREQEAKEAEKSRQQHEFILVQYAALHSEQEKRLELRQQMFLGHFVIASIFFPLGVSPLTVSGDILLFYPIITLFIAYAWVHNDSRIGTLGIFLGQIEEQYDVKGWEAYRMHLHDSKYAKSLRVLQRLLPNLPARFLVFNPLNFSMRGAFVTLQLLAILVGFSRCLPTLTSSWIWTTTLTLLLTDVLATIVTWVVVKHNRDRRQAECIRTRQP